MGRKISKTTVKKVFLTCRHPSQSSPDQACPPIYQAWRQGDDTPGPNHASAGQRPLHHTRQLVGHGIGKQTINNMRHES